MMYNTTFDGLEWWFGKSIISSVGCLAAMKASDPGFKDKASHLKIDIGHFEKAAKEKWDSLVDYPDKRIDIEILLEKAGNLKASVVALEKAGSNVSPNVSPNVSTNAHTANQQITSSTNAPAAAVGGSTSKKTRKSAAKK